MNTGIRLACATRIEGWMTEPELGWLAVQGQDVALTFEVGSWKGRSTRAIADNTSGFVHAIDTWSGHDGTFALPDDGFEDFKKNLADHLTSGKVVYARLDSLAWASAMPIGPSVDFVFLDGDHTYDRVRAEIRAYREFVKPGGVLSGHDYWNPNHPGVTQAVDEAFSGVNRYESIWWVRL